MRCHNAQKLISELLDGELSQEKKPKLLAHLSVCSNCREIYEDLTLIKSKAALPGSFEPSDRVWQEIKARLEKEVLSGQQETAQEKFRRKYRSEKTRTSLSPLPFFRYIAAFFIFLVFIAGAFYLGRHYRNPAQSELQVASGNSALQKIQEAEFYYRRAIQSLTEALQSSSDELPLQMVEVLQANLQLLDRTIELCQQAVNEQPDNLQAHDYLLNAYNSKLNFLNSMLEAKKILTSPGA